MHDVTTASGRHLWTQQTVDGLAVFGAYTYSNGGLGFENPVQRTFARPATTLAGAYALTADRAREIALAPTGGPAGSTAAATRVAFRSGPYENSTCSAHARRALVPRIFERRGILWARR